MKAARQLRSGSSSLSAFAAQRASARPKKLGGSWLRAKYAHGCPNDSAPATAEDSLAASKRIARIFADMLKA